MQIIRLQNKTPSIYTEESRDFQLFCRLYDCIINGLLFDSDTISELISTKNCRSNVLRLLQTKLGFFTLHNFDDNTLRYVLDGFPIMVKNKGSKKAIEYAVNTFLKINNIVSPVTVTFQKKSVTLANGYTVPDHTVVIGIYSSVQDVSVLEEIFKYILPFGTGYYFYFYSKASDITDLLTSDNAVIIYVTDNINSMLRKNTFNEYIDISDERNRLIGATDTVSLLTNYFNEQGDLIPTTNDSYSVGGDLLFLGIHYSDKSFYDYLSDNFNQQFINGNTILYNEKQYTYENGTWNNLNFIGTFTEFPTENISDYTVIVYNPSDPEMIADENEKQLIGNFCIYINSSWQLCNYPIYIFSQKNDIENT